MRSRAEYLASLSPEALAEFKRVADSAPPLTETQKARLRAILRGSIRKKKSA